MVISLNFFELMNLLSCFPSTNKYEKKAEYLICSLASNFWPVNQISEKRELENLFLSLNSLEIWTWNLRGYISHVVDKKKGLSIAPWRRNEDEEAELSFVSTESRKKSQRSQKAKRSSNQIKRVKENAWMLKLGEVC